MLDQITLSIGCIGAFILFFAPFGRYRHGSLWLRVGFVVAAALSLLWSALGFYLLAHLAGGHTSLARTTFLRIDHLKTIVAGIVIGLLVSLIFSPEAWALSRKKRHV